MDAEFVKSVIRKEVFNGTIGIFAGRYETENETGTIAFHECGFTPDIVLFFASKDTNTTGATSYSYGAAVNDNRSDDTKQFNICGAADGTNSARRRNNYACVEIIDPAGTVQKAASIESFDREGFTLNITTNGAVTWGMYYVALKMPRILHG